MDLDRVRYDVSDGIARITLNRPEKLNALTGRMRTDLLAAVEAAGAESEARVVALVGAGRAFCAGGDVADMAELKALGSSEEPILALMSVGARIVRAIHDLPKPVVALVDGPAAGAGAALACACDLRWVSERASFIFSWGRLGMHPDWGASWTLPRLVGASRAMEWMLLPDPVDASTAVATGLANRVFPFDTFEAETGALLVRLGAGAPVAAARTKASTRAGLRGPLEAALQREMDGQSSCWRSEDCAEGIEAFVGKRPPVFTGD
jgi:2-(1,2-epoxy-1,2-dihydrophenyl)acetyl-CoA isomerase